SKENFKNCLAESLFDHKLDDKILSFTSKAPLPNAKNNASSLFKKQCTNKPKTSTRYISSQPIRSLDLPGFIDDYYLNLVDWSKEDVLAVALDAHLYLWRAETGVVSLLTSCKEEGNSIA